MIKLKLPVFVLASLFSLNVFADCGSYLSMDEATFTTLAQSNTGLAPAFDVCVNSNYCANSADPTCMSKLSYYASIADLYYQKALQTIAIGSGSGQQSSGKSGNTSGGNTQGSNPQSSNPQNSYNPPQSNSYSSSPAPNNNSTNNPIVVPPKAPSKDLYNNINF